MAREWRGSGAGVAREWPIAPGGVVNIFQISCIFMDSHKLTCYSSSDQPGHSGTNLDLKFDQFSYFFAVFRNGPDLTTILEK